MHLYVPITLDSMLAANHQSGIEGRCIRLNHAADPGELHNLSSRFPDRVKALAAAWKNYVDANGVIEPDETSFYSKPVVGRKY